jgi:uncharacterized BrkB/YihY/UPF0761 family membrane protein
MPLSRQNHVPHPAHPLHSAHNHLPHWQRRLLDITLVMLFASGLAWLLVHYGIGAGSGPDSLPHPAEPWLMRLHGLFGFAGLFALGMVCALHVPRGWRRHTHRRSAMVVLAGWAISIISAWLLYYLSSEDSRPVIGWLHALAATLLWLAIALHRRPAPAGLP